jgi:hypothetical protein
MKNTIKLIGIAAVTALIVFSMAGCETKQGELERLTPTEEHFVFGNLLQLVGNVTPVTITPKPDTVPALEGAITVYYDGDTTLPSDAGSYEVTFDIEAHDWWLAADDLSAGTLTIRGPFTSAADLNTWLSAAPANTKTTPYKIPLDAAAALGGASTETGSVGYIFNSDANKTKYVVLDLSESTITSIEEGAFSDCSSLTGITLPDGVASIGNGAFKGCSLTSVSIPDSVTSIGEGAFVNCIGLTSITIPAGITSIALNTFSYCTSLTSITIPAGVTIIGQNAFLGCSSLTSITLPDTVTTIRQSAFSGCSSLTSITLPDTLTSIGLDAFSGCRGLTSITIPAKVTSITYAAFSGCSGLTAINVAPANTEYSSEDGVLYNKAKSQLHTYPIGKGGAAFTIPGSVTSIGQNAFDSCNSFTSITIPANVETINPRAFQYCRNLASITIADCDVNISTEAFAGCAKLTSVTFAGDDVDILYDNAFLGGSSLKTAYASGGAGTYTLSGATWSKN